jgi:hypothetical protein
MNTTPRTLAATSRPDDSTARGSAPVMPRAGLAEAAGGGFHAVVHLATVAEALAKQLPRAHARRAVLQLLQAGKTPLFMAAGDALAEARQVRDDDEWRPALPDGTAALLARRKEQRERPYFLLELHDMSSDEALWRGLPLLPGDGDTGARIPNDQWAGLPALPALRGRAGALQAFELAAAPGADRSGAAWVRDVHSLAVFEADALRLWPELGVRSFWEGEPAQLQAVPLPPAAQPVRHELRPAAQRVEALVPNAPEASARPAEPSPSASAWTPDQKQRLVNLWHEESTGSKKERGAPQRVLARWSAVLHERKPIARQHVKDRVQEFEAAGVKPTSAQAAASVFNWAATQGKATQLKAKGRAR